MWYTMRSKEGAQRRPIKMMDGQRLGTSALFSGATLVDHCDLAKITCLSDFTFDMIVIAFRKFSRDARHFSHIGA